MSPPPVSVVIPNYNHAKYVGDAIRSVLAQDYPSFEVVVVDDGSTDESREVIGAFGHRVRCIYQENRGLSAARNAGIAAATGKYVGVLDADDLYEPQFASTLVSILERDREAQAVFCGYRFVDGDNRTLPQVEARNVAPDRLYQTLAEGNFLVPESMLVRRSCYQEVGPFDESLRACEDLDMWLRISRRYRVVGTTRILTRHRVLPSSMSTDPARQCANRLKAIRKHFGPDGPAAAMDDARRRVFGRAYLTATVEHLQAGLRGPASELFAMMLELCPELGTEIETFYELGCGDQPKGYRGDFATLNVMRAEQMISDIVLRGRDASSSATAGSRSEKEMWGTANFVLALLWYGKRDLPRARVALWRALTARPDRIVERQFLSLFARTLLPGDLIEWFRRHKRGIGALTP